MRNKRSTRGYTGALSRPDRPLLLSVLLLTALGVVMVYSASTYRAAELYQDSTFFLEKHVIRVLIGLAAFYVAYRTDYRTMTRYSRLLILVGLFLLALVLIAGWEDPVRGSRRWLRIGGFSFQPSELVKLLVVLYLADFLARKREQSESFRRGLLPAVTVLGLIAVLIALEKNLSGVLHVSLLACLLLFLGGTRIRHLVVLGLVFALVGGASIAKSPYQRQRIFDFLDGTKDVQNTDYQVNQSLISLGSGGLAGVGVGNSRQKFFFLPDSHTDFVLSIVGEELGFVGAGGVMILFLVFGWRGARIAARAPDLEGRLLAGGITLLVFLYAMLNVAVVTNAVPTTGVPLPLVSYGGSSLLVGLFGAGVLLNISRHALRRPYASADTAVRRLAKRSS